MKIAVIGGGIFGVTTSLKLSELYDVTMIESNSSVMENASKCNHNRLHFGYHYPRSYKTAKQSLEGYELFKDNFNDSILSDFPNYYLIENGGKVTPYEYEVFCNSLNLDFTTKNPDIDMNFENIGLSLLTKEPIYDFIKIKGNLIDRLKKSNVNVIINKKINNKDQLSEYDIIINTTYSNINEINYLFDIPPLKLKLQDVLIPIFKCEMDRIGLTIMDGPYYSILPKGFEENTFLLYSVEHSVLREVDGFTVPKEWETFVDVEHEVNKIYEKSSKYFPFLEKSERLGYWRTIRALPINDDDERLSYLNINNLTNLKVITLLSGKITTCWLMANEIFEIINEYNINR